MWGSGGRGESLSVHGATCGRSELNVLIIALVRGCRFFFMSVLSRRKMTFCVFQLTKVNKLSFGTDERMGGLEAKSLNLLE